MGLYKVAQGWFGGTLDRPRPRRLGPGHIGSRRVMSPAHPRVPRAAHWCQTMYRHIICMHAHDKVAQGWFGGTLDCPRRGGWARVMSGHVTCPSKGGMGGSLVPNHAWACNMHACTSQGCTRLGWWDFGPSEAGRLGPGHVMSCRVMSPAHPRVPRAAHWCQTMHSHVICMHAASKVAGK